MVIVSRQMQRHAPSGDSEQADAAARHAPSGHMAICMVIMSRQMQRHAPSGDSEEIDAAARTKW